MDATPLLLAHLREECVETVDLLFLLYEGVVLGHPLQRQLVHQIDLVRRVQVLLLHANNKTVGQA